jgi:pimeloyl-ACP methyl ester carboxylesterase
VTGFDEGGYASRWMRRGLSRFFASGACAALSSAAAEGVARADGLLAHDTVGGSAIDVMDLVAPGGKTESVAFTELGKPRAPATYTLRLSATGDDARIPHCNGRGAVTVDGALRDKGSKGPLLVHLGGDGVHEIRFDVAVSPYEKRIACGERVRVGQATRSLDGLALLRFASPHQGPAAGEAVVFVPRGHDPKRAGALLVGVHPWNGSPWTYAAYRELLEEAQAKDVVLLMPSGLGNSLYTADAEDEVMRAVDALTAEVAVDRQRVSLWGASMGGQGATTIGWHRPDRFAFVASYFGDAKFDRSTYVRNVLPTEEAAHRVNPLDVVDNARHVPTWLIHGEDDHTSPIVQSVMLFDAMKKRDFKVDFDRVPAMGHEGPLVVRFIRRVVDRAAEAQAPKLPAHVTFRSTRGIDTEAYGVRIVRAGERDAYVDIEKRDDGIHVLRGTEGVVQIVLRPGALGAREGERVTAEPGITTNVRWGQ